MAKFSKQYGPVEIQSIKAIGFNIRCSGNVNLYHLTNSATQTGNRSKSKLKALISHSMASFKAFIKSSSY